MEKVIDDAQSVLNDNEDSEILVVKMMKSENTDPGLSDFRNCPRADTDNWKEDLFISTTRVRLSLSRSG